MTEPAKSESITWHDVRQFRDQLKLELHLAGMEAREQWDKLQPKLFELEKAIEAGANKAETAIADEVAALGAMLKKLLGDIKSKKQS